MSNFQKQVSDRLVHHKQQLREFEIDRLQREIEQFEKENIEAIY